MKMIMVATKMRIKNNKWRNGYKYDKQQRSVQRTGHETGGNTKLCVLLLSVWFQTILKKKTKLKRNSMAMTKS